MDNAPKSPLESLQSLVERCGSQKVAAFRLGVSPAYVNDMLQGRRDFSDNMARKLGFLRLTEWVPIKPDTGLAVSIDGKIHGDQIGEELAKYDREHTKRRS